MPVRVRNGRRRIISREIANTIIEGIRENNQITLKEMCTKVRELNGVVVSESTISRYLSFPESYGSDIPNYVLKRCHNRPPSTNSPENKEFRVEKVIEQYNAKRSGRILTYVDETSINLASVRNYGWAPPGTNAFAYRKERFLNLTAITFISEKGVEFCQFIKGAVNAEIFKRTVDQFISDCCTADVPRVFVMDNAAIHKNDLEEKVISLGHLVCYNAPNSPEVNPIEMIFGIWKSRCKDILNSSASAEVVTAEMTRILLGISVLEVKWCIEHVCSDVWTKIKNREDL